MTHFQDRSVWYQRQLDAVVNRYKRGELSRPSAYLDLINDWDLTPEEAEKELDI